MGASAADACIASAVLDASDRCGFESICVSKERNSAGVFIKVGVIQFTDNALLFSLRLQIYGMLVIVIEVVCTEYYTIIRKVFFNAQQHCDVAALPCLNPKVQS